MSDSDVIICRDGPLHRRVYFAADWAERIQLGVEYGRPVEYVDSCAYRELGTIYTHWPNAGDRNRLAGLQARVWTWNGQRSPSARADASLALCTRLGCEEPAVFRVAGETGRPWYGCAVHAAGMQKVLGIGQRADYAVTLTKLHAHGR